MKRIKKPKPLFRKKPPPGSSVAAGAGFHGVTAGFPEFWQKAHDHCPEVFKAAYDLVPRVKSFLQRPVKGPLATLEYFLTAIVANSLGALITLALNGYGHDAVRVARGMYEAAVNATYLKLHPTEVDDYVEFHWVRQKKLLDYFQRYSPSDLSRIPAKSIAEINAEFTRVAPLFQDSRGKPRGSWCKKDLRARAEEVGLGEFHPTFYAYASGIHHGDIDGLIAQSANNALRVELAPSFDGMRDALIMGSIAVVLVLTSLNDLKRGNHMKTIKTL